MINIAFCADNNYAMPAGVMMQSVGKHNSDIIFHAIIPADFSQENRARLGSIADGSDAKLNFIVIPDNLTERFPVGMQNQPDHITVAAYYRLFLSQLLPKTVSKVLYLDCDLICMDSLEELWETDLAGHPIACVSEIPYNWQHNEQRLGYDEKLGYFNSGVMLVNLDYWREHQALDDFTAFIASHPDNLVYHDQDVLNYVFRGKALFLPHKFNAIDMLFHKGFNDFNFPVDEVEQARYNPVIVHFTYQPKPWIKGCSHTYLKEFLTYFKETPWKGIRFKPKKATTFKGIAANVLVSIGLYKYHDDYINLQEF